jgi:thioredoxin-dependent peroxiredoxin
MAEITFKGNAVRTAGQLPAVGTMAPDFRLTGTDLADIQLSTLRGKKVVLNIFPSIDTGICAASARKFNQLASSLDNTIVLNISKDLPFAHSRFCAAEGLENVHGASQYKDAAFSSSYGVDMADGPLAGLMSRAVVIVNTDGQVTYTEQVADIVQEPNYDAAIAAL